MSVKRFTEDVYFEGRVEHSILPSEYANDTVGSGTIDASNVSHIICANSAPVNVTRITGGANYQRIHVRGDGFTTFQITDNITTNTGAAKLLGANKVYVFTYYSDVLKWIEDA